jgi:esterase/lipase superfamily enzyme
MAKRLLIVAIATAGFGVAPAAAAPQAVPVWYAERLPAAIVELGAVKATDAPAATADQPSPELAVRSWTRTDSDGIDGAVESAALAALARMTFGSIRIDKSSVVLSGGAAPDKGPDIVSALKAKLPAAYRLTAQLQPPVRTTYSWSAMLNEDGSVELSGDAPNEETRLRLIGAASHIGDDQATNPVLDRLRLRADAPAGFAEAASAALGQLRALDAGVVSLNERSLALIGKTRNVTWDAGGACTKLLAYLPPNYSCGFIDLQVDRTHAHAAAAGRHHRYGDGGGGYHAGPLVAVRPFDAVNPADIHAAPTPNPDDQDPRIVDLMFATDRQVDLSGVLPDFTGERAGKLSFGEVRIRIPERHDVGRIELPNGFSAFWLDLTGGAADPKTYFIIRSRQILSADDWDATIAELQPTDALVFVHGFSTTFDDAAFRLAQIVWDLRYNQQGDFKGLPVLYSWPSRGETLDYQYDRESALGARDDFIALLRNLHEKHHIDHIHVLAHSMGNFLALDALANAATAVPPLQIADLIMAAPDVDTDQFIQEIPKIQAICPRLTLYASSADKALAVSKTLAGGVPRAGDVPAGGPISLPGLDSLDVTAVGDDMFGMDHSVFAQARELIDDIALLLKQGSHPPRLPSETPVPNAPQTPVYWRFAP